MSKTKIDWADRVWNPVLGCKKVSPGCENCYAERMAFRLVHMGRKTDNNAFSYYSFVINKETGKWDGLHFFNYNALKNPFRWKTPQMVFVCSMSDLFYEEVEFYEIDKVFATMACNPQHTFIVLTKRPERALEYFKWEDKSWVHEGMQRDERMRYYCWHDLGVKVPSEQWQWPLPNVWIGVTAENQEMAAKRIPTLLKIPAKRRFVSVEPMLSQINLRNIDAEMAGHEDMYFIDALTGKHDDMARPCDPVAKLDWVIAGCESGVSRRPMDINWIRLLRDQCRDTGTPFFFKQAYEGMNRIHMPELDGKIYNQYPEK